MQPGALWGPSFVRASSERLSPFFIRPRSAVSSEACRQAAGLPEESRRGRLVPQLKTHAVSERSSSAAWDSAALSHQRLICQRSPALLEASCVIGREKHKGDEFTSGKSCPHRRSRTYSGKVKQTGSMFRRVNSLET